MERRTLAYIALGGSLLVCLPCGCFNGILAAVGASSLLFPAIQTGSPIAEDTTFTTIFAGLALLALIPAVILVDWSIRTLRSEAEVPD